mmetsp:Transcript_114244/g.369117  ORF Transcript_114244/g.369117 Transcript_114244/m.369117 type:complete len:858 (-) Transcript_114244:88-2661(-)
MACGMHASALGCGIAPDWGQARGQAVALPEEADTIEITALSEELAQEAAQILRDRQLKSNPISATAFKCKAEDDDEAVRKTWRKSQGDDQSQVMKFMKTYMPVFTWLPQLNLKSVQADVIAGLTVGVMVIPQGMSYAAIAGLPYIYGLYSACVPTFVYAFFGQSRQLAVGPVAMVSLLVEAGLRGQLTAEECPEWYALGADTDVLQSELCPEQYVGLACLTAATVGVMQIVGSVLKLGFLVSFLGHPVTSGFTSGAAIIIGLSQFKYFLGVTIPKSEQVYETVAELIKALPEAHWLTALLGFLWFAFLFITKKLSQRNKKLKMIGPIGPLVSCVVGIFLVWFCKPLREQYDVKYIGEIPSGLMPVTIGKLSFANVAAVVPVAISACLIGFMESIAISKNLATQHGYNLEARQELLALGVSNFVGSMFSCYPVTGSFSRSAVNNTTGAQTQLSGLITALVLLCTLLFLTPCFYYLPMFALAAIVMNSVISLIAYDVAIELFKVKRYDFVLWVVAFIGTLLLGVLKGVALAVIMSLVVVIFESVRPAITILWRVPGTTMYRAIELESRGTFVPNIFIARIGASMYFANASYIKDSILTFIDDISDYTATEYVVLDMSSVYSLDSTAVHTVQDIVHDFRHRGIEVAFVTVGRYVEKVMARADLLKLIGDRWMFSSVHAAVRYCLIHQYHKKEMRSFDNLVPAQVGVARVLSERSGAATSTSKTSRTSRRPRTESYGVSMTHTTEVGFSNETHRSLTVVFIQLERDIPGITDVILSVFGQQDVEAVRREVAGLSHTYFVQDANGNQLDDEVMELLKVELIASIERCADCPFPSDARMLELEQELARAHAKIKELETRLRTH